MTFLLDANVLIALSIAEHEHHLAASTWAASAESVAICPIVEGALVRFLLRTGESSETAAALIAALRRVPTCEFWPDALSYGDVDLRQIVGPRQVTDAYLVALALSRNGVLATFDEALSRARPAGTMLLPH